MKKLVFTAIAMIAFSGAAMASTVEATPCQDAAIDFYEAIIGDGEDDPELLNELLSHCEPKWLND